MVRLQCAHGEHGIGALCHGLAEEEFKFSQFVAAEAESGFVIPLDEQRRPAEKRRQAR